MRAIRDIIRNNAAGVVERIAWSMPTYERNEKSLSFAADKKHISFYIGVEAVDNFQTELKDFATKKSAVYLPYDKALPQEQLAEIVKWCLNQ